MLMLEEKLSEMDKYFKNKKPSEKWMIILGLAGFIAYMAYSYLLPYAENKYEKAQSEKKLIEKSISDNTNYLNSITMNGDREYYIKKYNKDIRNTKLVIETTKEQINEIEINLEKLSSMLFNSENWSIFLDSITETAEKHNLELNYIKNKYVDSKGNFGHVLEIVVGTKGNLKGIVKFMNEIEQNTLVTDIYSSHFYMDENSSEVISDINVSVWGINH